jgi:TfoX/Sxy family transcriptional regulator of competence genes
MASSPVDPLLKLFEEQSASLPSVSRRKMFGCEAFFKDGSIFGLIWKTGRIGLKFPDEASFQEAMSLPGAGPWKAGPMAMSHWVLVPETFHADVKALRRWIARAHAQASPKTKAKVARGGGGTVPKKKQPSKRARSR